MEATTLAIDRSPGFFTSLWFAVRNFAQAAALAVAFGLVIAAACLAVGVFLWVVLQGAVLLKDLVS